MREITETSEFSNLTNYLISKISSPYVEISYVIENNDSVEKILNKFRINNTDIKKVSAKLKNQKLMIYIKDGKKQFLLFFKYFFFIKYQLFLILFKVTLKLKEA